MIRSKRIAFTSGIIALALVAGVLLSSWGGPRQLDAAPVDLSVPALAPDQLGQWCVDRKAQGTAGLSSRARNWLTDCVAIFGSGLTPGGPTPTPSATQTASPSPSPTVEPSPTVSPTATTPPATTPPASPSPSPILTTLTPTVTPTAGPQLNCWNRLAECGYPTLATVGVPAGLALTPYTGPTTITVTGTVIDGKTIGCGLDIRARDVVIRNSRVRCVGGTGIATDSGPTTSYPAGTGPDGLTRNTRIERVEVDCVNSKASGIWGHNLTAIGVWVHRCENGFELNAWSVVRDSVVECAEANAEGHGDGIQSQGGDHVWVQGNNLLQVNPVTSAIITNPDSNRYWVVEDNIMGGGAYTFYLPENGRTGWLVQNNRFIRAKTGALYSAAFGLTDACGAPIVWINNRIDDNWSLVPC